MENSEVLFYAHRDRFNTLLSHGQEISSEGGRPLLLPQSHRLQRAVPLQPVWAFNVPFGRYARIRYIRDFSEYRDALAGWTFMSADIESVPVADADFIYADPPYDVEFTQYARGRFTWDDQERTASGWRATAGRSSSSTRRRPGSRRCIESSGTTCVSCWRPDGSTTPAIAHRRVRSWPRRTSAEACGHSLRSPRRLTARSWLNYPDGSMFRIHHHAHHSGRPAAGRA